VEDWEKIEALREGLRALYSRVRRLEQQNQRAARASSIRAPTTQQTRTVKLRIKAPRET
jgi:multidrug efflux pump subunit AcrA (membrane-fusion protein)